MQPEVGQSAQTFQAAVDDGKNVKIPVQSGFCLEEPGMFEKEDRHLGARDLAHLGEGQVEELCKTTRVVVEIGPVLIEKLKLEFSGILRGGGGQRPLKDLNCNLSLKKTPKHFFEIQGPSALLSTTPLPDPRGHPWEWFYQKMWRIFIIYVLYFGTRLQGLLVCGLSTGQFNTEDHSSLF